MIDKILENKDTITFTLSLIGALGTVGNMIYIIFKNRVKLNVDLVEYIYHDVPGVLLVYMSFNNKSNLPVSITNIAIKQEDKIVSCKHTSDVVFQNTSKKNKQVIDHYKVFSIALPINVSSLNGTSGYLQFVDYSENPIDFSKPLTFLISTNRDKTIELPIEPNRLLHQPETP